MQSAAVTRTITLPVSADEAWRAIAHRDGLARWFADTVDVDIIPGAAGTVIDGSTVRRLVVTQVDEGRSVGFVWWDDAAPAEASVATIALAPTDAGTAITVTEHLAGAAVASVASARAADLAGTGAGWDQRLQALLGAPALAAAFV